VTSCSTVGGQQVLQGTVTNPLRNNAEIIAINVEFQSATGTHQAGTTVALGPSLIADFTRTVPGSSRPTCRVTKTAVILVLLPGVPYVPANGVSSAVPTPTSLVGRPLG
jgi:hypothetical protein